MYAAEDVTYGEGHPSLLPRSASDTHTLSLSLFATHSSLPLDQNGLRAVLSDIHSGAGMGVNRETENLKKIISRLPPERVSGFTD